MVYSPECTVFKGSKDGAIVKQVLASKAKLEGNEIAMDITHSGARQQPRYSNFTMERLTSSPKVCGTDLRHLLDDIVLGHEGIGTLTAVGSTYNKNATHRGDRVGFGYVHGGCGKGKYCKSGDVFFCETGQRLLRHHIPAGLSGADAAPFMCASQAVFTPMLRYGVKAGDRVGIIGIDGLGHLAIGFASKLGAEVVVFSSTEGKREEALQLGATEFWVAKDLKTGKKPEKTLDFLIATGSGHPEWATFLELMTPLSHIVLCTLMPDDMVVPFLPFMLKEISIHSMLTATPDQVNTMLNFAADKGVKPIVEEFPMTEDSVKAAVGKLFSRKIGHRGVLTAKA